MPKVVIDANVFVSVILGGQITGKICKLLTNGEFKLLYSPPLFEELKFVLSRKEFELNSAQIDRILTFIETNGEVVFPVEKISVCRDPKDNPVLECAAAGMADFIITGDADLLSLKFFRKTLIVTPRKFLQILKKQLKKL